MEGKIIKGNKFHVKIVLSPKYSAESNKRDMLEDLTSHLETKPSNKSHLLYELAQCVCAAIDAEHVNFYIHKTEGHITKFAPEDPKEEYVSKAFTFN